jgi:hypothetical protein
MKDRAIGIDGVVSTLGGISKKGTKVVTEWELIVALMERFHTDVDTASAALDAAYKSEDVILSFGLVTFNRR